MSFPHVLVIGKEYSLSSQKLRKLLDENGLPYSFIDLDFHKEYQDLIKFHRILSIPVLFIGDHWIVGYEKSAVLDFIKYAYRE